MKKLLAMVLCLLLLTTALAGCGAKTEESMEMTTASYAAGAMPVEAPMEEMIEEEWGATEVAMEEAAPETVETTAQAVDPEGEATDIGDKMPAMRSGTYDALCIRAALARMASYHIDQSLYDMTVLSPDGSICAVAKVGTFLGGDWGGTILTQYDRMVFTDTATGDVLWEYPCEELYMIRLRNQQWSPDGRYFALTFGSEHGADSMVFDVSEKTARAFPDIREIAALAGMGEELPEHYHILVKAWREDGRLDGEVFFDYGMTTIGEGSFVFDPLTGEISDFVCDVYRREDRGE